ncbi:MAG: T9SS type A sorting domain-containing protein [Saprospiraceae bacterium]|nr:T9SS type A sorting domain-containing protein [Saprospiraceae bacterium]
MKNNILLLVFLCTTFLVSAQQSQSVQATVEVTYAEKIGTTPPVRSLVNLKGATPEKRKTAKDKRREIPNFSGRRTRPQVNPNALPQGPDPIRQWTTRDNGLVVEPLVNKDGIGQDFAGATPPDPDGDVGSKYYVQVLNASYFQVHDKEGMELSEPIAFNTLWSSLGFSSAGDPIVIYDQEFDRWILTEFPSGNQLLFAISDTDDPLDTWTAYNFGTPNFPDYPKYSLWSNAFVVTTNEQGPSNYPVYLINRDCILNGDEVVPIQRLTLPGIGSGPGFQVATPVDWSGQNPPVDDNPIILGLNDDSWGDAMQDQIEMWTVNIDWNDPNNTSVTNLSIPTSPFDTNPCAAPGFGFACIPQPNGNGIDGLPEVIMNQSHYRNFGSHESIVLNFITDVTGDELSGIRWVELRRTAGEDWSVYQEGTYAPDDGLHRFMGGIAMDGNGNIALGYSVSSLDEFPGIRITGRRASDPLGEMTVEEVVAVEGQSNVPGSRFGDYAKMAIDPADDKTFWYTGEYMGANGWETRIIAFQIARDTIDIGPTALLTPQDSPDLAEAEEVAIEIQNFGLDTQYMFRVGYIFEDGPAVIDTIEFELAPDSTYQHTFTPTVDMSVIQEYEFKIFTGLDTDQAPFNDTLRIAISKLTRNDIGVLDVLGLDEAPCDDSISSEVLVFNFGADTLFNFNLNIQLNGTDLPLFTYEGDPIAPNEGISIPFDFGDLLNGTNTLAVAASGPNGQADDDNSNNIFFRDFEAITNGAPVYLNILTDDYPSETTWEVTNEVGEVIFSGGPYAEEATLFVEELCLDPEACYTFTIFDSYGDGICCGFGEGNYSILDADDQPLLLDSGEFGDIESTEFCATFSCSVAGETFSSPESEAGAGDGSILVETTGGIEPFSYSIDGENFQDTPLFDNLPAGDYTITISDAAGCDITIDANVPVCAVELMAEVINEMESGTMTGQITVIVNSGNPPYTYSIDGGQTFQQDSIFTNLSTGDYTIIVEDGIGCQKSIDVFVDLQTNSSEVSFGHLIELFPNPTEGVVRVNVKGLQNSSTFLPFEIYDANGKLIQSSKITKYDGTYTGLVSLVAYPSGTYFIRLVDQRITRLLKVVKK